MQQSTLPTLISPNPAATSLYYRLRLAFATNGTAFGPEIAPLKATPQAAASGGAARFGSVFVTEIRPGWQQSLSPPVIPPLLVKKAHNVELKGRTPGLITSKLKQKKNATASFSCLPSFFINSAARAGGRPGGGRLETASHVTEQSKGMYLKVSSRLATSTAHRPHLPRAAQRSKQAWIRTKPLITSLPLLRLFGTAAKPAASAAAAHTGESHSGPCTGIPPRLFP